MSHVTRRLVVAGVVVIAVVIAVASIRDPRSPILDPRSAPASASVSLVSADIGFYEKRASEDAWSAADRAALAMLYLQRGRETGEYADFQRAEQAARAALKLRHERNGKAMLALASSLLAQHRFVEARAAAEDLLRFDPSQIGNRALLAEIMLELGDYDGVEPEFRMLEAHEENLAVAPRVARWHEIHGRNGRARTILHAAATASLLRADLPAEQKAWFHLRIADHELRNGRIAAAERAIQTGLKSNPGDFRLLSMRARAWAAREQWERALLDIDAVGEQADLATLALGGEAALAMGQSERAQSFFRRVEEQARAKPEPFARQWTQYCLERRLYLDETVATLEAELRIRPDVLGHQLLAVGYQLQGRSAEARATIQGALRVKTQDALLQYQASRILDEPVRERLALRINRGVHRLPGSRVLN